MIMVLDFVGFVFARLKLRQTVLLDIQRNFYTEAYIYHIAKKFLVRGHFIGWKGDEL